MAVAEPRTRGPRRRHKRYRTHTLELDQPVAGRVVNVGPRGIAVESPERLFNGGSYNFRVRLGEKQLRLSGRIQWCRLVGTERSGDGETRTLFRAGIAFDDSVTGKAWREALRRLTHQAPHVILHRARSRPPEIELPRPGG